MRRCFRLWNEKEQRLPLSHLDLLRDALDSGRDEQTAPLSFSDLRVPAQQRRIDRATGELVILPGAVQWWIASPDDDSLTRLALRFAPGNFLPVGKAVFVLRESTAYSFPNLVAENTLSLSLRFSCRTPVVTTGVYSSANAYEPLVRQALLETFARVYDRPPYSDAVGFAFDADYLRSHPRGGTKRIDFRGETVDGILAPFVLTASPELLRVAWECGVGERTEDGFGFAEIADT
ncbi:MAG: hypothetical protein H7Y38_07940 [Armatimonadetes bacterium]|nr:hypothetical protein [Armatimonadota bacterium]